MSELLNGKVDAGDTQPPHLPEGLGCTGNEGGDMPGARAAFEQRGALLDAFRSFLSPHPPPLLPSPGLEWEVWYLVCRLWVQAAHVDMRPTPTTGVAPDRVACGRRAGGTPL